MVSLTLIVISLILPLYSQGDEDLIIQLPKGKIRGLKGISNTNKTFYQFEKIPYAKPPVGSLRFEPPVPPDSWNGILNTFKMDVACYQSTDFGYPEITKAATEDCLYLNVYTPKKPTTNKNVSLPVLLAIHGGFFLTGSSAHSFMGPEYLLDENIVIVTINYRLGILGFLSTGDLVVPGNMGLKDQQLAIEWTHENIALFGGDPNKIVIYGESAGAASVAYQLLNKKNEGRFTGVIASSGTAINDKKLIKNMRLKTNSLAKRLNKENLNISTSELTVAFLQQLPVEILYSNSLIYKVGPTLEPYHKGAFISKGPYKILRDGEFVKVPIFLGFNSEEGLFFYKNSLLYDFLPTILIPEGMELKGIRKRLLYEKKIKQFYVGNQGFTKNKGGLIRYTSDNSYVRGIIKHAQLQSKYTDVYVYQFSYDGKLGNFSRQIPGTEHVAHSEDLHYLWCDKLCFEINTCPDADQLTQKRLIRLYTNFVKYLNPTPKPEQLLNNVKLPKFNPQTRFYLNINKTLEILINPRHESIQFWDSLYKSLGTDDFDTY